MELIIHIGVHKTGSSSLQSFLNINKEVVADHGLYWPKSGWVNGAHHQICYDSLGIGSSDLKKGSLESLVAEISSLDDSYKTTIISSEEFERFNFSQVDQLVRRFPAEKIKVIAFLRRQDHYLASDYSQQIKMGASLPPLDEYVPRVIPSDQRFDLLGTCDAWAGNVGADNFFPIVYCPKIVGAPLYDTFQSLIGLPWDDRLVRPDGDVNKSWSYEETIFANIVNKALKERYVVSNAELTKMYSSEYLRIRSLCGRDPSKMYLTAAGYELVRDQYSNGNEQLIDKYGLVENADFLRFDAHPEFVAPLRDFDFSNEAVEEFIDGLVEKFDLQLKSQK